MTYFNQWELFHALHALLFWPKIIALSFLHLSCICLASFLHHLEAPCSLIVNCFYFVISIHIFLCTVGQKKLSTPYLFQFKLSYRNEILTNHHELLSTSVWCFKILMQLHRGFLLNFYFFDIHPQMVKLTSQISWN